MKYYLSPLLCFTTSLAFALTWVSPFSIQNGALLPMAMGYIYLELVILHSGTFISIVMSKKGKYLLFGLIAFYSMFALGLSAATGNYGLLWGFLVLSVNRILPVWTSNADDGIAMLIGRSIVGVLIWMAAAMLAKLIDIPELGLTQLNIERIYDLHEARGNLAKIDESFQYLRMAMYYFALAALFELKMARKLARSGGMLKLVR